MNILINLFVEFFKTGLFAVGGGLATLPFLYEISEKTGWYTLADVANMVAVSESTPGPIGINMATYVGFTTDGILGSLVAPLGLVIPSIIIIIAISKFLEDFKDNKYVNYAFYGLRAASSALILAAGIGIAKMSFFSQDFQNIKWIAILIGIAVFITFRIFKKHPIWYLLASGVIGIICSL